MVRYRNYLQRTRHNFWIRDKDSVRNHPLIQLFLKLALHEFFVASIGIFCAALISLFRDVFNEDWSEFAELVVGTTYS